jgi:hypothetical protein
MDYPGRGPSELWAESEVAKSTAAYLSPDEDHEEDDARLMLLFKMKASQTIVKKEKSSSKAAETGHERDDTTIAVENKVAAVSVTRPKTSLVSISKATFPGDRRASCAYIRRKPFKKPCSRINGGNDIRMAIGIPSETQYLVKAWKVF